MKSISLVAAMTFIAHLTFAQLVPKKNCSEFNIDLLKGKVNDMWPTSTIGQINEKFPCSTSQEAESTTANCGGGIFYKDRDVYFYTGRDYIQIGPAFKGKLSLPLLNAARGSLFKWLGHPKLKDTDWDAFTTAYGTLVLFYKAGKVNRIIMTTHSTEHLKLCD